MLYNVFIKDFHSLISFMKWILSTIVTIIYKLNQWLQITSESEFVNNIGLGLAIFIVTLFSSIVIGKSLVGQLLGLG